MSSCEDLKTYVLNKFGISLNDEKSETILNFLVEFKGLKEDQLLSSLNSSEDLIWDLINRVIVPETYFFRNIEHIRILMDILEKEFSSRKSLLLLSAGCSTGEEAYTLAIILKEKFPRLYENSLIYGIDLNPKSIEKARMGVYTKSSIRNDLMGLGGKYITSISPFEYRVAKEIKRKVNFMQGNLIDFQYGSLAKAFDIILCRNVFIYFDPPHIIRVLKKFSDVMHDNSYLFVGHSEMINQISTEFQPLLLRNSFVFQKAVEKAAPIELIPQEKDPEKKEKTKREKTQQINVKEDENRLEKIRESISQELYDKAREQIDQYIESFPKSVHARLLDAILLIFTQQHDAALKIMDALPDEKEIYYYKSLMKGILFSETGDLTRSIKYFKMASEANPTCLISNFFLGFLHEEKRFYRISRKYYGETLNNSSLNIQKDILKIMPHLSSKQLRDLAGKKLTTLKSKEANI